jgi:hypothetical protein
MKGLRPVRAAATPALAIVGYEKRSWTARVVAAVLPLMLVLSGCGGGGGGGGGGFLPVSTASSPATSPAGPATVNASPKGLHYARDSVTYPVGAAIAPNNPAHSDGAIDHYDIKPALPAGLAIDAKSGVISGTPLALSNPILYTVTGSNASGSVTAGVRIEVSQQALAPANLHYSNEQPDYRIGQAVIPNTPSAQGGAFTQVTVAPALPAGLSLDPVTGVISGAPTQLKPRTDYTVTASNSAGSSSIVLHLAVLATVSAPSSLGYSEMRALYSVGQPIMNNQPVGTGGAITSFSVTPALPTGLSLDTIRGVISGTPQTLQSASSYAITGSNEAGAASATVSIAVVAPGSLQPTGSTVLGRSASTATLLPNGKVLIVGGFPGPGAFDPPTKTAELYDPSTGQWRLTGSMRDARIFHTATLLPNGKVLVAGGIDSDPFTSRSLSTAELYDPATGLWTATGSMNSVRNGHAATLLPDGKVLITGTRDPVGNASTAELYDPGTGLWTATGSMNGARTSHTAALLPDGKVLVLGGSSSGLVLATAELYDPATGSWTATGSMSERRLGHSATLLPNGKVLAAGGMAAILQTLRTAEIYDPSSGQWTATTSMAEARYSHTATLLADGKVLALGGTADGSTQPLSMELYDPTTDQWAAVGSMSTGRIGHTATRLLDGKVLVAAGTSSGLLLNTAHLFVPLP